MALDASTVGSWNARLWKRSVTGPALASGSPSPSSGLVPLPPELIATSPHVTVRGGGKA